jgi:hypothetical protein
MSFFEYSLEKKGSFFRVLKNEDKEKDYKLI